MKDEETIEKPRLQWHPAFYAGIQIEFEKESKELIFENEHQLGTKPKAVDVLITKKNDSYQVKKNIGKFFRKYNLIEYKPPGDSLNIDDFYKACGYGCFYKADSAFVNAIKIEEITLTFITHSYPREMIKNLKAEKRYSISKVEQGICSIKGGIFPIQLVVTKLISEEDNFWLWNLNNKLKTTKRVYEQYQKHSENKLYTSVMDIIVKANKQLFKEEAKMCQALYDLFEDELMKMVDEKVEIEVERRIDIEVEKRVEEKVNIKAAELAEVKAVELAEIKAAELAEEKLFNKQKEYIESLISNAHFTLEQALNILMIPEEKRILYNSN